jgi:hypothetical protein
VAFLIGSMEHASRLASLGRRSNPVMPNWTDVQPWVFYDRLTTAVNTATPTLYQFFTVPMGGAKTKNDTNLKQAGRLPDPKHFFVTAMRFVLDPFMKLVDIKNLFHNYYVEWEIGDKVYAEGHLDYYAGGSGIAGHSTNTSEFAWNNGIASPNDVNQWGSDRGIHILQGQTFQVRVLGATFTTSNDADSGGVNLRCLLEGILYREVQ